MVSGELHPISPSRPFKKQNLDLLYHLSVLRRDFNSLLLQQIIWSKFFEHFKLLLELKSPNLFTSGLLFVLKYPSNLVSKLGASIYKHW